MGPKTNLVPPGTTAPVCEERLFREGSNLYHQTMCCAIPSLPASTKPIFTEGKPMNSCTQIRRKPGQFTRGEALCCFGGDQGLEPSLKSGCISHIPPDYCQIQPMASRPLPFPKAAGKPDQSSWCQTLPQLRHAINPSSPSRSERNLRLPKILHRFVAAQAREVSFTRERQPQCPAGTSAHLTLYHHGPGLLSLLQSNTRFFAQDTQITICPMVGQGWQSVHY